MARGKPRFHTDTTEHSTVVCDSVCGAQVLVRDADAARAWIKRHQIVCQPACNVALCNRPVLTNGLCDAHRKARARSCR